MESVQGDMDSHKRSRTCGLHFDCTLTCVGMPLGADTQQPVRAPEGAAARVDPRYARRVYPDSADAARSPRCMRDSTTCQSTLAKKASRYFAAAAP